MAALAWSRRPRQGDGAAGGGGSGRRDAVARPAESLSRPSGTVAQHQAQSRIADGAGHADRSPARAVVRGTIRPAGTSPTPVTDRVSGPVVCTVSPPRSGQEKSRDAAPEAGRESREPGLGPVLGQGEVKRKPPGSAPLAARSETFTPSALRAMEAGENPRGRKWTRFDQGVGGQDQVVAGPRRQAGRVVPQAESPLAGEGARNSGRSGCPRRAGAHRHVPSATAGPGRSFFSSSPRGPRGPACRAPR